MRRAGGGLVAGACAVLAGTMLAACTGGADDEPERVHAAASSAPARSAGALSPSAGSTAGEAPGVARPSLQSAAERWQEHPDEAPEGVSDSGLLLNRRGRGPQTVALPDLRGSRALLMTLTCASDSYYRVDLQDAGGRDVARIEGDCSILDVYRTGLLDPGDPPVRVQVETPRTVDYYLTVYGLTTGR